MARLASHDRSRDGVSVEELAHALAVGVDQGSLQSRVAEGADGVVSALLADRRAGQAHRRCAVIVVASVAAAHGAIDVSVSTRRT